MRLKKLLINGSVLIAAGLWTLSLPSQAAPHYAPGNAAESRNTHLVGHHDMQARSIYNGHVREQGGRFIAYVGHHNEDPILNPDTGEMEANGTSIVDVTDPANPVYLKHLHANAENADVGGGARSSQTCSNDELPNGGSGVPGKVFMHREVGNDVHELWDVTVPGTPEFITNIGLFIEGTHKNWWECSTGIAYLTNSMPGWNTRVMSIWDLSDPTNPIHIRDYIGLPGAQPGGDPTGLRMTEVHEPLYLDGKVYMAHGTRTDGILQILDNEKLLDGDPLDPYDPLSPTEEQLMYPVISRLDWPDFQGVHTAVPILGMDLSEFGDFDEGNAQLRDMLVVVNESTRNECTEDMHQMTYIVDITDPAHPIPVSTFYVPEKSGNFCERGGRFGAHSTQWNIKETIYRGRIVWISYFNAGVRGVDIRDPYNPIEVAHYIPKTTHNTTERCVDEVCKTAIQTNNVDVDDRGYVYLFDRANTGMHIIEVTGRAKHIANF